MVARHPTIGILHQANPLDKIHGFLRHSTAFLEIRSLELEKRVVKIPFLSSENTRTHQSQRTALSTGSSSVSLLFMPK